MLRRVAFERPPVIETVLGIEFEPIQGWGIQYFGLFWAEIRDRFPKFEQQPPIISGATTPPIQVQLGPMPTRGWFIDASETRVIQVQNDRFNYNWRERPSQKRYPHYEVLRSEFEREWSDFRSFLSKSDFPAPTLTQASVTYVNHIPQGEGWASASDFGKVLRVWNQERLPNGLQNTKFVNLSSAFELANGNAVRFDVQPGLRLLDNVNVIQLTVVISGKPLSEEQGALLNWFDNAQRELVESFVDFTTDEIQANIWLRKA